MSTVDKNQNQGQNQNQNTQDRETQQPQEFPNQDLKPQVDRPDGNRNDSENNEGLGGNTNQSSGGAKSVDQSRINDGQTQQSPGKDRQETI